MVNAPGVSGSGGSPGINFRAPLTLTPSLMDCGRRTLNRKGKHLSGRIKLNQLRGPVSTLSLCAHRLLQIEESFDGHLSPFESSGECK